MIEGLKFDVKASEMKTHLQQKVSYHRDRAAFYTAQIHSLKAGRAEAAHFTNGDPIQALESKCSEHTNRAELFEFLERHLIAGETYRLEEDELVKLEFISKGYRW